MMNVYIRSLYEYPLPSTSRKSFTERYVMSHFYKTMFTLQLQIDSAAQFWQYKHFIKLQEQCIKTNNKYYT